MADKHYLGKGHSLMAARKALQNHRLFISVGMCIELFDVFNMDAGRNIGPQMPLLSRPSMYSPTSNQNYARFHVLAFSSGKIGSNMIKPHANGFNACVQTGTRTGHRISRGTTIYPSRRYGYPNAASLKILTRQPPEEKQEYMNGVVMQLPSHTTRPKNWTDQVRYPGLKKHSYMVV